METVTVDKNSFSLFNENHSLAVRVWHWATFLVISASLTLVLLASTMFTTKSNIPMVTEQVQQKGGVVTPAQARAVAHEYSDKLWMAHKYVGYGICFLFLCRIIIEVLNQKDERLAVKIRNAVTYKKTNSANSDTGHYLYVKYGYVIFYLILMVMAVTGLGLAYEDVPFLRSIHKPLIQVHSIVQYLLYLYIVVHLVGVIRADVTVNKGIVSGMIHGDKL